MKIAAIICNIASFVLTCLVLSTDGMSKEVAYIIFTMGSMWTPILSVAALFRGNSGDDRLRIPAAK